MGINFQKGSASIGSQGIVMSGCHAVQCNTGFRIVGDDWNGEDDYKSGSHMLSNLLVDSGNETNAVPPVPYTANGYGIILQSVREVVVTNCYLLVHASGSNPIIKLLGAYECCISNTAFLGSTAAGVLMTTDANSRYSHNNLVNGCVFRGGMSYEVKIDTSNSNNIVRGNNVASGQTRACLDSGTANRVGDAGGKQISVNMGGATAVDINGDITEFAFGKKPQSGMISKADFYEDSGIVGGYDYASAASTAINARFRIYMADGSALPNQTRAFNISVSP